jgi:ferritin-like protein
MPQHYLMQFFEWKHLPDKLKAVSVPFEALAREMDQSLPDNPEKTMALQKLLEAKDCAVRATLYLMPPSGG